MTDSDRFKRFQLMRSGIPAYQAAAAAGLTVSSWRTWQSVHQHEVAEFTEAAYKKRLHQRSYVSSRPAWERERMRHFGAWLHAAADSCKQPVKISGINCFMDEYIKIFGESKGGGVQ